MTFLEKLFPKAVQHLQAKAQREEREYREARKKLYERHELERLVGAPVISVGNNWGDPCIGFGTRVIEITKALNPALIVMDYSNHLGPPKEVLSMGIMMGFSEQRLDAILKLDPHERWTLLARNSAPNHARYGTKVREHLSTPDELRARLQASGFQARWEQFKLDHSIR